ncbi:MAG: cytochrome C, partial [Myxococcaceae bacterium]|nr:cytochrome C [Myxococcaceae bacterium]
MKALALFLLLAAAPPAGAPAPRDTPKTESPPRLLPKEKGHASKGLTRCGACHATSSWAEVRFNHDKTGFPLAGKHARVDCRGCHTVDFEQPVPRQCAACHRDAHTQDLGARCEGCHDEWSWRSAFNADAHRRTNFPLVGAHSIIACQECHAESRDRRFARPTVTCAACHAGDLARTAGTAIDHAALGFTQDCQQCHAGFAFTPARFPGHDACFTISFGSHARFSCTDCHTTLQVMTMPGL